MIAREAYSYRGDPEIAPFPDDAPVVIYDGVCVLCSVWVRMVLKRDGAARFLAAQSPLGRALFRHYGVEATESAGGAAEDFETWLLLEDGRAYEKAEGVARMLRRWGGGWALLGRAILAAPGGLRGWLYPAWRATATGSLAAASAACCRRRRSGRGLSPGSDGCAVRL